MSITCCYIVSYIATAYRPFGGGELKRSINLSELIFIVILRRIETTMTQASRSTVESYQIGTLVNRNIDLMQSLASSLAPDESGYSKTASQLARFKLWASSLGAHRESGHRSLGYRLRDASSTREHVIKLLGQLGKSVEDGI